MSNHAKTDFDVGIIGGGPAGAAIASYLAKAGAKCVVFEREIFPRPHVGESFVPSSTRVFQDLGFIEKLDKGGFPRKLGAVWTTAASSIWSNVENTDSKPKAYSHDWEEEDFDSVSTIDPNAEVTSAPISFSERKQEGINQNYTYHVDRGKFDQLFLQHAHQLGAAVYEGVSVKDVDFSDTYPSIKISTDKKESDVKVRMIVDASGRRTVLGNRLKLKVNDPRFDQYAVHTWFEGYAREAADISHNKDKGDYIFVHFLPLTNSWVWQIPITDTITSIGVVTQKKNFLDSKGAHDKFFWDCVKSRPEIYDALKQAKQIRPFTEEADYSYAMKQICGNNFILLGDAARFVDPIFSSGVSIALNGARFAKEDILPALETNNFTKERFAFYERTLRNGTRNWYDFINLYYRLNVLFTVFINDKRYRLDILKLLQGDVWDEIEPEVLVKMRQIVSKVESNPNHIWHKLLGSLTANSFSPTF
jgi:flavin-dependent dehydrogenase